MKKKLFYLLITLLVLAVILIAATTIDKNSATTIVNREIEVKEEVKEYWYDGKAELSSYHLTQARYGELHEGTAVLVYVTEPFSKSNFTKADEAREDNISVLKLNRTKKFNTGIYPYSMMTSTFFPFDDKDASVKITSSVQEWCGMTYLEMKPKKQEYAFSFNSYFEGASFEEQELKKAILEDDLWSLMRINPNLLPTGQQEIIPSMLFLRLRNRAIKTYTAEINLSNNNEGVSSYELKYPELERRLNIQFSSAFPHTILAWQESYYSGFGKDKKMLTSTADLIRTVKTDYWNHNHNEDKHWREKLDL